MDLDTRFKNVAVVGAAGKMGSGISLLAAQEMAFRALERKDGTYVLNLIDVNDASLQGLLKYLREQSVKTAEKQVGRLRAIYAERADLVENGEMIQAYVDEVMSHLRTGKTLQLAAESLLVFEAAFEKEEIKFGIYDELRRLCPKETYFFTNTSSIPLHIPAEKCGIQGRLIGFHFYNPPAVQKLVELITPEVCDAELKDLALQLAKALRKTVVPSNDLAGFIGNGHFTRDGLYAIAEVERLAKEHGFVQAVYMVDKVSRDWLLRPMGIFQLIDYVGVDVFQLILTVMSKHLGDAKLHSELVDRMMSLGAKGGQTSSGAQKDGFLNYEKGKPVAVYDLEKKEYVALDAAGWSKQADEKLGAHPNPAVAWKSLSKDAAKEEKIRAYFGALKLSTALGADLARRHFTASRDTGRMLVSTGVAQSPEDVNAVLTLGFFHVYGPINDYL
ncbi:MAG TPA: 3-hydroxyacyl-CoA dehydrogenase family protein [Myxococcales bacterium]|jgi:3-hydroxyacyl-CoA dehydrogenase